MVICLERGADLHMAQLMPMPLSVSCFSKIQIGFTCLVLAHPGSPGKRAVKTGVCIHENDFAVTQNALIFQFLGVLCPCTSAEGITPRPRYSPHLAQTSGSVTDLLYPRWIVNVMGVDLLRPPPCGLANRFCR